MSTVIAIVLAVVALVVWWLTGFDKSWDGHSKRERHFTRALRTVAVVFFISLILTGNIIVLLFAPLAIALLLRGSISEIFTGGFLRLLDPSLHDSRAIDLKRAQRHRDNLAWLIHHGQRDQAIKLCEELKKSGELDEASLAHTLEFLGVKQDFGKISDPLHEAGKLRAQGNFSEAEIFLKARLEKNPADSGAALMLMRVYAEDLRRPNQAAEALKNLERQPNASKDHLEFARRSLVEWSRPKRKKTPEEVLPQTLDKMLEKRFYGSAIELLEEKIKAAPKDFDLRLKLAEVHAVNCENISLAEKMVRQLALEKIFSAEQIAFAEEKLKEWRAKKLPLK